LPGPHEPHAAGAAASRESRSNDEPAVLVRKLGSARVPTYLERVLTEDGEHRFVVVERVSRGPMTEEEACESVRDARMAAALEHPNVVRTRAIGMRLHEISVTSDYVAGERLSELWSGAPGSVATLPLEIALRILVDVSTGLGALHKLRSTEGHERLKFVHGEVTDENVLVGLDGVSSILRASRVRSRNVPTKTGIGALAPEILSGMTADPRADIYGIGALLWQALSGKPLFPDDDVAAILASAQPGTVAGAVVKRNAAWALPLASVAARALAPAPDQRFPTASSMVTELRKIAGPKLATAADVAKFVEAVAGEKIAARLADAQASAVIRKATSIPAPRPSLVEAPVVERSSGPSKLVAREEKLVAREEKLVAREEKLVAREEVSDEARLLTRAVATPIEAPTVAPTPVVLPTQSMPLLPAVSPKTETARAEAIPEAPSEPETPPAPVAEPVKATSRGAAAALSTPLVAKAVPAVPALKATPSPLLQRPVRSAIGVWLAIALLTGLLALLALHSRQVIVTPDATRLDASTMPAPASSAVPDEVADSARRPYVASPTPRDPALGTTSTAKGRLTNSASPRNVPAPKLRPK